MTWEQYKAECVKIGRTKGYLMEIVESVSRSGERGFVLYGYASDCGKYGTATMSESGIRFVSPSALLDSWPFCAPVNKVSGERKIMKSRYVPLLPARAAYFAIRKLV